MFRTTRKMPHLTPHYQYRQSQLTTMPQANPGDGDLIPYDDNNQDVLNVKRQWSCGICGAQFTLQSSYSRHIKYMHSAHRSYICLQCGANFKRKDNLASHLKHRHMNMNKTM